MKKNKNLIAIEDYKMKTNKQEEMKTTSMIRIINKINNNKNLDSYMMTFIKELL
jgi:hypothetical protein